MKLKTSDLTGSALDWAVAKAYGQEEAFGSFSTNWLIGGPIIEREKIDVLYMGDSVTDYWRAEAVGGYTFAEGPTPLIAAMRCFVSSKLGDEIDVPEELL